MKTQWLKTCPLALVIFLLAFPPTARAATPQCDPAAATAHGGYFTDYQSDEYSPSGLLTEHFKNNPDFPYPWTTTLYWRFFDDECNPANPNLYSAKTTIPLGVTDWSIRFASSTRFDVWDDDHHTIIASSTIDRYPPYTSVSFIGTLEPKYITLTHFEARTDKIVQDGQPPQITNDTLSKDPACPSMLIYNNMFDPSYEHAEYAGGLLRVHLKFTSMSYSGQWMRSKALSVPPSCDRDNRIFSTPWAGVTPPHNMKYFSFRMTSPTHWVMWNDETDTQIICSTDPNDYWNNGCEGNLDPSAPYVSFYLDIGSGSVALIATTPFHPVEQIQACIENCNSNVLFLPGIEASRLYDTEGGERRLWEPNGDADARQLTMTSAGSSTRSDIYTKDILDEAFVPLAGPNVYKSFIADMDALKATGKIADWQAAPYDWRLSLEDILTHGTKTGDNVSYLTATSTPYIEQELRRLAASSRTGKVTIIAHSNGGLVAKALMAKLGVTTTAQLIDKVIFVAVPQVGTPAAVGALLHGEDQSIPIVLSASAARSIAQNMPSVYNLLPSSNYFTYVDDPVITFDPATLPEWAAKYGNIVHSTERLRNFITDIARTKPAYDDLVTPEINNAQLFDAAQAEHAILDAWVPPDSVQVIRIAGWGNETLSGIGYKKVRTCFPGASICTAYQLTFNPKHVVDGDGTVVAPSALWMNAASSTEYWVDMPKYNREHRLEATPLGRKHRDILEVPQLRVLIADALISTTTIALPQYISASQPSPSENEARLHFTLHSPLTIGFTDAAGNYTGASATGTLAAVPGVRYERYGDVQWISIPADMAGQLVMHGTASGSFTLDAERTVGNVTLATTSFEGIPSGTSTMATIDIDPAWSITASSTLVVDQDGNGTTDTVLHAREGATVFPDTTPPELTITFATSTNSLAFLGTDNMGTTTITSTTTHPILKQHQKEYKGIATTTVTARDEAGNTTALVYTEKLPSPKQRDTIALQEVDYNGATTTIASTTISYKWRQNKDGQYKFFASHLKTVATSIESHYRPKKDITIIMIKPRDLDDTDDDDDDDDDVDTRPTKERLPGMIIPSVATNKGTVNVIY